MSKLKDSQIGTIIFLFDVIALILAFIVSSYLVAEVATSFFSTTEYELSEKSVIDHVYSFTILSFVALFILYNKGHYSQRIPWWSQVRYISGTIVILLMLDGFLHFTFKEQLSRLLVSFSWICGLVFILVSRQLSRLLLSIQKKWCIESIILGDGENAVDTLYAIASDSYSGYQINNLILRDRDFDSFDRDILPKKYKDIKIFDGRQDYSGLISANSDKFFIIALDAFRGDERDKMMDLMSTHNIDYVIVPPIKRVSLYGMEPQFFFGHDVMFLSRRNKIKTPFGRFSKRAMDIIGSATGLIVLSPVFLICAFLIKRDGGSIFYGDRRVGKDGEEFTCWKFRSMAVDAHKKLEELLANDPKAQKEFEQDHKLKDDPRVTKIGAFLRKTSIDELPQMINILKGSMSIVGPRPITDKEISKYEDNYRHYTTVKPGLTGLWQVSGRNDASYSQRVRFDCWYVRNWSLWHDIVIIFKTFNVVLRRVGAY